MYEVLDKDTIKSEILPYLSVAKRGYVTKKRPGGGHSVHSLQVENRLSVAHASRFSHLHGEGFELQERVCPFPQVVEERRMEKGLGHDVEPPQVFLGHVQCGFGRQPHHHASRWRVLWIPRTQEKNDHQCHLCHRPARHTACHVHACFGFPQRPSLHLRGTSGLVRGY